MGEDEPDTLRNTIVYLLGLNFTLRGGAEQRNLHRPGFNPQISVCRDSEGVKYLKYVEDSHSKTNQGGLTSQKSRPKEAKVYGSDDPEKNVVCLYEKYTSLLPPNGKHPSLYKFVLKRPLPNGWYSDNQVGQNTLQKIVKTLCEKAGLSGEKFCNHSLRATCATRMYQARVEEQVIQQFTGHSSEVVRKYKTTSDELLKVANKTVSGNQYQVGQKRPVSATISVNPDKDEDVKTDECPPKIEVPKPLPGSKTHTKTVCTYLKDEGCEGLCDVLKQVDKHIEKRHLKRIKLSLKYDSSKN